MEERRSGQDKDGGDTSEGVEEVVTIRGFQIMFQFTLTLVRIQKKNNKKQVI